MFGILGKIAIRKILPYFIVFSSIFWVGWEWRDRSADLEVAEKVLEIEQLNSSILIMAQKVSEEAENRRKELSNTLARVDEQNAELEALRQREDKVIYKEVVKYVEKVNPEPDCNALSDDWVQLYNISITTNLPSD